MKIIRHHFTCIDSTNTWAKQHASSFDPGVITLVTADNQSAGRGRLNRRWISPFGQNVCATYSIFLPSHRRDVGNLPQVAAISIAQILAHLGFCVQLKWPNDIVIGHKKLAGILSESITLADKHCLLIGVGLNINVPQGELDKIGRPAASLLSESGRKHDVEEVLSQLSAQLTQNIALFLQEGFSPFLSHYRMFLYKPAQPIIFHDNLRTWTGHVHSINADGSLTLLLEDGANKTFHAGEVLA